MRDKVFEVLCNIAQYIPFLLVIQFSNGDKHIKVNFQRIVEAVLIAVITGVIATYMTSYVTIQKLNLRMNYIESNISKLENKIDKIQDKMWTIERFDFKEKFKNNE